MNGKKDSVSVKEVEEFTKKYKLEVFFCLSFILACFFSFVFFGTGWCVVLASLGGILGVVVAARVELFFKKSFHFVFKQEKLTQLVLAIAWLVLSMFVPPLVFLKLGLYGGKSLYHMAMEMSDR